MLITINLREFYPFYTHDVFVEVTVEVAEELKADKRYEKHHEQRVRRNKSFYSLDVDDGIEASALACHTNNPEVIFFSMIDKQCNLCSALNSLPELQRRRVNAHYLLGMSQTEIAKSEGVILASVNESIRRGLRSMKKYLKNNFNDSPYTCPTSEAVI